MQVKEAKKMSMDVQPQVQHLPLTPIHEEKMDDIEVLEMPQQEAKPTILEEPVVPVKAAEPPKLTIQIPEEPVVPVKAAEPRRSNRRHRKN